MENFDLAILFTTAGALVGAGLIKTLVSSGKALGIVPENGRGVMYAALLLSTALIGLALWGSELLADGVQAQDVLIVVMSILGIYTSSIGVHETVTKIQNISSGSTNPSGPDR